MAYIKLQKNEAVEFLSKKGRRIEIIFFGLILTFISILPVFLFYYLYEISLILVKRNISSADMQNYIMAGVVVTALACIMLFAVFVIFPTYSYFFKYVYRIYSESLDINRRYACVSRGRYHNMIGSGLVITLIFALCLAPLIALVALGAQIAKVGGTLANILNYLFVFVVFAGIVIGWVIFLLFRPLFLFCYFSSAGEGVLNAMRQSARLMRTRRAKQIYKEYMTALFSSLILSAATLLILFFIDALPKMTVVYYRVADDIILGDNE